MARCPSTNQRTAKTQTTQGNDRRASESMIPIGNDLVWVLQNKCHSSEVSRSITLTSKSRQYEKRATDKSKKQTHNPEFAFPCERRNGRDGNRDLKHGYATREHFVLVKI